MCFKLFLSIFCHLPPFSVKLPKNGVYSLVAKSAENGILIAKNIHFFSTSRFFVIISIRIARIFIQVPLIVDALFIGISHQYIHDVGIAECGLHS